MKVVVKNEKSQQVRIVDLSNYTISQFVSQFPSDDWNIVKYIRR